jgi:uncharacterized protein (DUF924 family)
MDASDIISFWFEETPAEKRFAKDDKFDSLLRERFLSLHQQASCGELYHWRGTAEGRLAEIIILDQFSRNMFRDQAVSFAQDGQALILAQEAVAAGFDQQVSKNKRGFFYLPYMHSESAKIHEVSLKLYTALGAEQNLEYEKKHKAIIDRFGRYPHRNKVLGRISTPQEEEFLKQPGSGF